jgi:hypothetical protein
MAEYKDWPNHQTWCAYNRLTSYENLYQSVSDAAADGVETLKTFVEEYVWSSIGVRQEMQPSLASDLIQNGLQAIDYHELRQALMGE